MDESLTDYYLEELKKSNNKVQTLVSFYKSIFDITEVDKNIYIKFSRLYKIYGYKNIFMALLDCTGMDNINFSGIDRLISYFAKKRLEEKFQTFSENDLTSMVKDLKEKMNKKRKLKFKNPFEDNNE